MKRVHRLRAWLGPTFLGTALGAWTIAIFDAIAWDELHELAHRLFVGSIRGFLLAIAFVLVDVVLAKRAAREIPTNKRAFWMSFIGPVLADFLYILPVWEPPGLSLLVLGGKLLLTAVTVRLLFGRTPR